VLASLGAWLLHLDVETIGTRFGGIPSKLATDRDIVVYRISGAFFSERRHQSRRRSTGLAHIRSIT
jgi:hypothetical protein